MKKNNNRGFTLAELLIVVAIIAVLVAVAIPVFTTQLENSRDGVSISNIRAAYAQAQSAYLTSAGNKGWTSKEVGDTNQSVKVTTNANGVVTKVEVGGVAIKSQKANSWGGVDSQLPFDGKTVTDPGVPGDYTVTFNYSNEKIDSVTMVLATAEADG